MLFEISIAKLQKNFFIMHPETDFNGILLGLGNPLLDIGAHVPTEFLEK
jgi:hypothetical protein